MSSLPRARIGKRLDLQTKEMHASESAISESSEPKEVTSLGEGTNGSLQPKESNASEELLSESSEATARVLLIIG